MYQAKMIKTIKAVPDGEVYPREYKPGDIIEGDIALVAVEHGWAVPQHQAPNNKAMEVPARGGASSPFPALAGADGGDSGQRTKPHARGRKPRTRKG
jgi:hypothetical protein